MMKWKWKSKGFREILMSGGTQAAVLSAAGEILAKANANAPANSRTFASKTWKGGYGGGRWIASVQTTDTASAKAEAENKALSKAVGG